MKTVTYYEMETFKKMMEIMLSTPLKLNTFSRFLMIPRKTSLLNSVFIVATN